MRKRGHGERREAASNLGKHDPTKTAPGERCVPADTSIPDTAVPAPCPVSAHCHQTASTPAVRARLESRTPPVPRRSTGRRRVQRPRDGGPETGGLSRGSAEVGVAAGAWGPAPRGSEGRGEAKSQADPRDATLDPTRIPPLLRATRLRKGGSGPSWARSPPWAETGPAAPRPEPGVRAGDGQFRDEPSAPSSPASPRQWANRPGRLS